jgi:hypothetical protein
MNKEGSIGFIIIGIGIAIVWVATYFAGYDFGKRNMVSHIKAYGCEKVIQYNK